MWGKDIYLYRAIVQPSEENTVNNILFDATTVYELEDWKIQKEDRPSLFWV